MTFNGQLICQLLDRHDHDVFTESPLPDIQNHETTAMVNSTSPRNSIGSERLWHQRLGHPGPGSMQHIRSETVKIDEKGPKTFECKDCALNKATKLISRRPTERARIPFERVHFDLVTYSPIGFDGSRYMLHFCDDMSRMNFVYLLANKSGPNLLRHFKNFVAYTKRQFKQDIKIFRCDQESGLGRAFEEWVAELGIVVEWSAVRTSEQNGQSERSGGVIQTKARCLGNSASLPSDYWPEFVMTAAYLINRSPTSSLGWLSPLSTLRQSLKIPERDEYSHLKAFGCTAYALDKSIAKGDKMKPRAKTGFLVGYNSRNIYRILLLDEEVVIGTRDVIFDENLFLFNRQEPTVEDDSITVIDFTMTTPVPDITLDIEDVPIRNNEPNIQTNDDDKSSLTLTSQSEKYIKTESSISVNLESEVLPEKESCADNETHWRKLDRCAIDENNILTSKRIRKKSEKAESLDPSALVSLFNVFVIGNAKSLQKLHQSELPPPPNTWNHLKNHQFSEEFWNAMKIEYNTLVEKNTIQLVRQSDSMHPIPLRCVFTYKLDEAGYLLKFKARICVRGDLQPRTDEDNYASTLAFQVFRVLMALVAYFDLETLQVDAVNAFCNSPLDEEIYLYNPPGFGHKGQILRLLRGLYGLRKSPKLWLKLLSGTLLEIGLYQVPGQSCVYTDFKGIIIFFFVDDLVFIFPENRRHDTLQMLQKLTEKFEFRILGELEWFLGVKISRNRINKILRLSQQTYIEKTCREYGCCETKSRINTPLTSDKMLRNIHQATPDEIKLYQKKVGSLIYASGVTRPDIARAVSHIAEFMSNPSTAHLEAVDHCLYYLYQTRELVIKYTKSAEGSETVNCSADAAFANTEERRSVQGFVFKLCGGPVHWNSSKQATVTTSSTEAELLSLSNATKELIWMQRLFAGIKFHPHEEVKIFNDNIQTIRLLNKEDPIIKTRLKHVDIYQHWLREQVQQKQVIVSWVSTNSMVADGMTKSLSRQKHEKFVSLLNLVHFSEEQDLITEH
ncbi:hypothetical protein K3495_g11263 [Podosphaera aphanis]|nr:hypothetical protein K3495_g11263 [Podosphaera aphanis]